MPIRRLTVFALALSLLLACEPDARNDAIIYLDRVSRIDLDDSVADRRRLVQSLASLPLSSPEVQAARDACVEAHQTILTAEELSQAARAALTRYESEDDVPVTARHRIGADIDRSTRLIDRSRPMFDRCHRLTRDLEVRHRRGRRSRDDS